MNRAIALRYDEATDQAPVVVAGGDGALAQMIARAADDYGIPIVRDVPLAAALSELAVGEEIPEELYGAVSAILREMGGRRRGDVTSDQTTWRARSPSTFAAAVRLGPASRGLGAPTWGGTRSGR